MDRSTDFGHTPGPWILGERSIYALQQDGWRKGEPVMVNRFYVQVQPGRTNEGWTPQAELDANARLIAAAPDLLYALEYILSCFDDNDLKLTVDAIQESRSAVKKAVGTP